jgi:hypothetical protein
MYFKLPLNTLRYIQINPPTAIITLCYYVNGSPDQYDAVLHLIAIVLQRE